MAKWVLANFKMHKTIEETTAWITEVLGFLHKQPEKLDVKVGVAPSYFAVPRARQMTLGDEFLIGVQNV